MSSDEDTEKWVLEEGSTIESTTPGFTDPRKTAPNGGVAQSEEDEEKAREFKMSAAEKASEGNLEEAIIEMTKALELGADKGMFWAQRAEYYLKQKAVLAAIHDATVALEFNPSSAKALKVRGTCYRHLHQWEESSKDLNAAQAVDFNDAVDALLKIVQPKALKIRDERRKKELDEAEERHQRALAQQRARQEAQAAQDAAAAEEATAAAAASMRGMPGMGNMGGGMPGGMPAGMGDLFSDPEIVAAMQDPEVAAKFASLQSNPAGMMGMMADPKMAPLMQKIMQKMMGGGMPDMSGMGGGGAASGAATNDDDLD